MVQRRSRLRLQTKSLQHPGMPGNFLGKKLQRDVTAQLQVLRVIDNAHTAAADLAHNAVVADDRPGRNACRVRVFGTRPRWKRCTRRAGKSRPLHKFVRILMLGKQRLNLAPQRLVAGA